MRNLCDVVQVSPIKGWGWRTRREDLTHVCDQKACPFSLYLIFVLFIYCHCTVCLEIKGLLICYIDIP